MQDVYIMMFADMKPYSPGTARGGEHTGKNILYVDTYYGELMGHTSVHVYGASETHDQAM